MSDLRQLILTGSATSPISPESAGSKDITPLLSPTRRRFPR